MNFEEKNEKQFTWDSGKHIFFTSDSHFSHLNIIRFCDRPFKDAKEMNEKLIENWNSVVGPDDIVFHLGDFCFGGSAEWSQVLDRLNGKIYLILGNHDMKNLREGYMKRFEWVGYQAQIYVEGQCIYLNHYPFLCYGGIYRKNPVWQLFGHVHSKPGSKGKDISRLEYLYPTQYDVGMDNNDYKPISFNQVKNIIEQQIALQKEVDEL